MSSKCLLFEFTFISALGIIMSRNIKLLVQSNSYFLSALNGIVIKFVEEGFQRLAINDYFSHFYVKIKCKTPNSQM